MQPRHHLEGEMCHSELEFKEISGEMAYCVQSSLLEMWRFDEEAIEAVTIEEVIEGVNRLERRQGNQKFYDHPMI